eukprot:scaffold7381_cov132-Isochrysis_galbana.AAC.4
MIAAGGDAGWWWTARGSHNELVTIFSSVSAAARTSPRAIGSAGSRKARARTASADSGEALIAL